MTAADPDARIEKLEKALANLRRRVEEGDRGNRDEIAGVRYAVFVSMVAGVLLALTATTWRTYRGGDPDIEDVTTLWGMVPEGWQGAVTLGLILLLSLGTVTVFVADTAGRPTYLFFVVVAIFTVVAILFVGLVEPEASYEAEDTESGPGRWLALFTALTLAVTHASRGAGLRR
jgi:hypothetical protein